MPEQGKNQLRKRKILLFLLSYRGKMRKNIIKSIIYWYKKVIESCGEKL